MPFTLPLRTPLQPDHTHRKSKGNETALNRSGKPYNCSSYSLTARVPWSLYLIAVDWSYMSGPSLDLYGGIATDDLEWKALHNDVFQLYQCTDCHTSITPAYYRCRQCGSREQDWLLLKPVERIYSWTRTYVAFPRTATRLENIPFTTVLVKIDGTNTRVLGVLNGSSVAPVIEPGLGRILPANKKSLHYPSLLWRIINSSKEIA